MINDRFVVAQRGRRVDIYLVSKLMQAHEANQVELALIGEGL